MRTGHLRVRARGEPRIITHPRHAKRYALPLELTLPLMSSFANNQTREGDEATVARPGTATRCRGTKVRESVTQDLALLFVGHKESSLACVVDEARRALLHAKPKEAVKVAFHKVRWSPELEGAFPHPPGVLRRVDFGASAAHVDPALENDCHFLRFDGLGEKEV